PGAFLIHAWRTRRMPVPSSPRTGRAFRPPTRHVASTRRSICRATWSGSHASRGRVPCDGFTTSPVVRPRGEFAPLLELRRSVGGAGRSVIVGLLAVLAQGIRLGGRRCHGTGRNAFRGGALDAFATSIAIGIDVAPGL